MSDQPTVRKKCNEAINEKIGDVLARQVQHMLDTPAYFDIQVIDLAMRWLEYNELPVSE